MSDITNHSKIIENLIRIEERISEACIRSNRKREDVLLIAVSKTKPISYIEEAYRFGIRSFGENRVQELVSKFEEMPKDINWHMIGHLQKNKVKAAVKCASLIHSVDTFELAETINKESLKAGKITEVLLEINIAGEDSKFGMNENELYEFVEKAEELRALKIKGLMTVAPIAEEGEKNRIYFNRMRKLFVDIGNKNKDNIDMKILSMGMSSDFETAIEEGATMVRIGSSIFGER